MPLPDSLPPPGNDLSWPRRLHAALMPDYTAAAAAFWWAAVLLGTAVLAVSLGSLGGLPAESLWQIAAGVAIAVLLGFFPMRLPRSRNAFGAGQLFVFLLLLLHGPGPAVLAAAGESLVGAWRSSRRWTSRIASPAMAALAMGTAGLALQGLLALVSLRAEADAAGVLAASMACALLYAVLNTMMVSAVLLLKRGERLSPRRMLDPLGATGIAYCASAAVAALLFLTAGRSGPAVLFAAVPIMALLVAVLHVLHRQRRVDEAHQRDRREAAAREAALAEHHVRELAASEQRFHSAFTHASIGMLLVSFEGMVLQSNKALRALLGHEDEFATGQPFADMVHADDADALAELFERMRRGDSDSASIELRCLRADGAPAWVSLHSSFFSRNSDGAPRLPSPAPGGGPGNGPDKAQPRAHEDLRLGGPSLILQVQDISARRSAEARLQHIAFHDGLTGLPNRARLHEHLEQAIALARRDPHQQFALMFLDFDRFKLINDSLGHAVGDEFLIQVARRLQNSVRPGDVVARLGGDEFVVLVAKVVDEAGVVLLAERLQAALGRPFSIASTEVTTSASIGITFSRFGYATPGEVLRDADIAMYRAKSLGKARHALFDVELHTEVSQRLRLEGDLRQALDDKRLEVHFQPLFELSGGALTGFEALVRWQHPQQGLVPPALFVPIAEESGLVVRLTDFVLHEACRHLRRWTDLDATFADLSVQVNLSGNDLSHPALVSRVLEALVGHRLQPHQLTLELTENTLSQRLHASRDKLDALRHLGVGLSVDDFGTGYSSLSHLANLPVDSLKIDRSFIGRIGDRSRGAEVLRAIVMLGRSLGKTVVAEGIENERQLEELRAMGCDRGQGYHLSPPLAPRDVDALLRTLLPDWSTGFGPGYLSEHSPLTRH